MNNTEELKDEMLKKFKPTVRKGETTVNIVKDDTENCLMLTYCQKS